MPKNGDMKDRREFGLWGLCPPEATVAWGSRWILEKSWEYTSYIQGRGKRPKDGKFWSVSPVMGRGSVDAPDDLIQPFLDFLNAGPADAARKRAAEIAETTEWFTRSSLHLLYEDERVVIQADSNASYGYIYVIGWMKDLSVLLPVEGLREDAGCTVDSLHNAKLIEAVHGKPVMLTLTASGPDQDVEAEYPTGFKFTFDGFGWGYGGAGPHGLHQFLYGIKKGRVSMDRIAGLSMNEGGRLNPQNGRFGR